MRWSDRALVVLAVLALAGCGSGTRPSPSAANSEAKEAAEVQVKLGRGYMEKGELEVAMEKLQRAHELFAQVGVKKDMERLERRIKAATGTD